MICRKVLLFAFLAALIIALAACDSAQQSTPTAISPSASPTSSPAPTAEPTAVPTSVPSTLPPGGTSVSFEKSGGIAGIHDKLEINAQAEATYTSGSITGTQTLPAATYGALLKQIETADFFNLKDNYDNGGVSDDFYYTITVRQGDRAKTVRIAQVGGRGITPQSLLDLVDQLSNILAPLDSSPPPIPTLTTSTTATTVTPGTPGTPAGTGDTLITAVRTGGIAGVNDTLMINPGGQATYTGRNASPKEFQLSAFDYNNLLAQIDRADFFNLQDSYDAPGVADAFTYVITVSRGGRTKSVSVTQGSQLPQGLSDLLAQFTSILDAHGNVYKVEQISILKAHGNATAEEEFEITSDARVFYTKMGSHMLEGVLTSEQHQTLLASIYSADFFNLQEAYGGGDAPDAVNYMVVVYTDTGLVKRVYATDGAALPQPVQALITQVSNTIALFEI